MSTFKVRKILHISVHLLINILVIYRRSECNKKLTCAIYTYSLTRVSFCCVGIIDPGSFHDVNYQSEMVE